MSGLGFVQGLGDVGNDVFNVFNTDRQPHQVFAHTGTLQLVCVELAVGSGGRVASQGLGIADVHQAQDQIQGVDELRAGLAATLDAEAQNAGGLAATDLVAGGLIGAVGQAGVVYPLNGRMILQELGNLLGVVAVTFHTQGQGFQALHDQERVERRQGRAGVTQRHDTAAAEQGSCAQSVGVNHSVVGGVRLVHHRDFTGVGFPVELAGIHYYTSYRGAVTADVLGQRVNDDICAMLEWTAQEGRGYSVINNQRNAVPVGDFGPFLNIHHVAGGVADGFAEQGAGLVINGVFDSLKIIVAHHLALNALIGQ